MHPLLGRAPPAHVFALIGDLIEPAMLDRRGESLGAGADGRLTICRLALGNASDRPAHPHASRTRSRTARKIVADPTTAPQARIWAAWRMTSSRPCIALPDKVQPAAAQAADFHSQGFNPDEVSDARRASPYAGRCPAMPTKAPSGSAPLCPPANWPA